MSDIVEFVHEEYPFVKYIQFEPLNWVRKTERVECISPPDVKDFAENLIKAHGLCTKYNINMSSCFGGINNIRAKGSFCDAVLGHCLMLNYDGDILNCSEASNDNKRTYEKFLIGHIDDKNRIEWFNTPIPEKKTTTNVKNALHGTLAAVVACILYLIMSETDNLDVNYLVLLC